MRSAWFVHLGLAAFFVLMLASMTIVVSGSLHPTCAGMIPVGAAVPDFALPNTDGSVCEIQPAHERGIILLSSPVGACTSAQERRVRELQNSLAASAWTRAIGVVAGHIDSPRFLENCQLVLVDEHHTLWPVTGADSASVSICLISPEGRLQTRWIISSDGHEADGGPVAEAAQPHKDLYAAGNDTLTQ